MRKELRAAVGCVLLVAGASSAAAETDIMRKPGNWRGTLLEGTDALVATNKYGEPLFIQSGESVGGAFVPASLSGDRLASEFKNLCIETAFNQAALARAASTSSLGLGAKSISVAPQRQGQPFTATVWTSPAARVQVWSDDTSTLKGRQTLSRWRNGATSSSFRVSDVPTPSCGLTIMTTDFHNPATFITAMSTALGAQPAKAVTKSTWADGFWSLKNTDGTELRVSYSMTDLDRAEQLLHVSIVRTARKR